jgi:hypothetical protein
MISGFATVIWNFLLNDVSWEVAVSTTESGFLKQMVADPRIMYLCGHIPELEWVTINVRHPSFHVFKKTPSHKG